MSSRSKHAAARSAALEYLLGGYLRPYQRRWLMDASRRRVILKARQVGISDLIALEMVLTSSGLHWSIIAHNCTIISKTETDAYDVIKKAKRWVEILRRVPGMAEQLRTVAWSASEISFTSTGFRIISQTQNPNAGRGKSGHLYLDEYAFYQYQREIWTAAIPSVFSTTNLRVSVVSTPNGTGDHFHEIWTDADKYPDWSRHKVDVHEAVQQGFPLVVEDVRNDFSSDQWAQEMECKFIGGEHEYFTKEILQEAHAPWVRHRDAVLWMGIDTASVVDTTAVQCIWLQPDGIWLGDTYILEHVQYETDVARKRMGQDTIIDAIMQVLMPAGAVMDVTGDQARRIRGFASLFSIIRNQRGQHTRVLPQNIDRTWKDTEVQEIKTAMLAGRVKFAEGRRDMVFARSRAGEFSHTRFLDIGLAHTFLEMCFQKSDFPVLTQDFRKIHRKWLGPNSTTFDAERDGTGHADAFWAAILGHSVARRQRSVQSSQQVPAMPAATSYSKYL